MDITLTGQLHEEIEPNNPVDKYAVAIKKWKNSWASTIKKEKKKKNLQTTIFYFLRGDSYEKRSTTVPNKAVNLGDGDVMQLLALYTYQF